MEKPRTVSDAETMKHLLEKEIPENELTREYEKCITRFANAHCSEEDVSIFHALMDEGADVSYKAFFCLATIYRHTRDFSKLRKLIETAEADDRYRDHMSLKHIRVMYETHSESLYDYDELLSLAHESACALYDNCGYHHTFANTFATICENCLAEDLGPIMEEWYESALLFVNRAIDLEPEYAKYYSTKARIIALKNRFEEANRLLIKAIDLEDSGKKDYALLIGNYQYYRTMISIKKQQWLLLGTQQPEQSMPRKQQFTSSTFRESHDYAFVSYSHSNSEKVHDLIEKMQNRGVNIWFDGDIPGGAEWDQEIGKRLLDSHKVILFLSQTAILSRNVRNEIRMAQNHGIPIIPVYLEDVSLSPGAELQLSGYHSYRYYKTDEEAFLDSILDDLSATMLQTGKATSVHIHRDIPERSPSAGAVEIVERFCEGKDPDPEKNEDILIETDDFIAVIDGASSKDQAAYDGKRGGRLAAEFIGNYIRSDLFERDIDGKTAIVRIQTALKDYSSRMGFRDMGIHLCASAVIFSIARRQIWSVGDCQFMINGELHSFPKKVDEIMSQNRALLIHMLLKTGETEESLMNDDKARKLILSELEMQKYLENQSGEYGYSVFSDQGRVLDPRITGVPAGAEVILASDGYPLLYDTLEKSEQYLQEIVATDPLCYKKFRSTKGLVRGNRSFDDRTYIRFRLSK